ncbi:MAG: GNVR domain-containing protein [Deltaproteobacteria bacterium]
MSSEQQENNQFKDLNNRSNLPQFPNTYHPQKSQGINLYFLVLQLSFKRNWWLLSVSVLIVFLGTWSYLKLTPKIYVARVSYEVSHLNPINLQQRNGEGRVVDLEEEFLNQYTIRLFQKIEFLSFFLDRTGLTPLILRDLYDPTTDTYDLPNDLLSPAEFAAASLKNPTFEFQTEKSSGLTSLTVHFRDPDLAVSLANDGLRWANDYLLSQEIVGLQRELDSLGQSLSQLGAEKAIEVKSAKIETSLSVSPSVLENLQQRLIDRQIELGVLQKTQPSAASITDMKAEIGVLEAKLAELNKQRDVQSIGDGRDSEEISKLRIQFAQTQARLQLLQSGQQPLVRIIDRAIPPENPSKPNVRLILALSLVVGLFGGVFLVFLVDFVRKTRQRLSVNP